MDLLQTISWLCIRPPQTACVYGADDVEIPLSPGEMALSVPISCISTQGVGSIPVDISLNCSAADITFSGPALDAEEGDEAPSVTYDKVLISVSSTQPSTIGGVLTSIHEYWDGIVTPIERQVLISQEHMWNPSMMRAKFSDLRNGKPMKRSAFSGDHVFFEGVSSSGQCHWGS